MLVCGIDVANKSLAVSIIYYNEKLSNDIDQLYKQYKTHKQNKLQHYANLLEAIVEKLNARIYVHYVAVIDLLPEQKVKDTTPLFRAKALYDFLSQESKKWAIIDSNDEMIYVIEYQMGPNDKTRAVSSQIMLFLCGFINNVESRVYLIGPSLKNKVFIKNNEQSKHLYFLSKYKTNYNANKTHAKFMLDEIIKQFPSNITKYIASKKKYKDDIADSILMPIAFCLEMCHQNSFPSILRLYH
jgi:hypothetical protein